MWPGRCEAAEKHAELLFLKKCKFVILFSILKEILLRRARQLGRCCNYGAAIPENSFGSRHFPLKERLVVTLSVRVFDVTSRTFNYEAGCAPPLLAKSAFAAIIRSKWYERARAWALLITNIDTSTCEKTA